MDLQSKRQEILRLAACHGARSVRLFGSVRGEKISRAAMSTSWSTWRLDVCCAISSALGKTLKLCSIENSTFSPARAFIRPVGVHCSLHRRSSVRGVHSIPTEGFLCRTEAGSRGQNVLTNPVVTGPR